MGVPAVKVATHDALYAEDAPAGAVLVLVDGTGAAAAYYHRCPGCRRVGALPLTDRDGHPCWRVVSGDPAEPSTVTLEPSVLHPTDCGWHGYLRGGQWVSC